MILVVSIITLIIWMHSS